MHSNWQTFLESQSGRPSDDDTMNPEFAPSPDDCTLSDLSSFGLIRVSGADTATFLQGQLTNDIDQVTSEHSQLSALCNPKGRMLALFRIFQHGDALYLQAPRERIDPMLKRLTMYVLRAQVTLTDASDELVIIGLAGGHCAEALPFDIPNTDNGVVQHDGLTIIRLPGDRPRLQIVGPCDEVQRLWELATAAGAQPAPRPWWPILDIRAGVPNVYDATAEAFVPQMANLELLDGVSFTKGCYTGQEVVARMHYLGKLKRRMYLAKGSGDIAAAPGDNLYPADGSTEQAVGKIVDARPSTAQQTLALAVVQIDAAAAGDMRLGDPAGPLITLQDPPYPFSSEEATDGSS